MCFVYIMSICMQLCTRAASGLSSLSLYNLRVYFFYKSYSNMFNMLNSRFGMRYSMQFLIYFAILIFFFFFFFFL